MEHLKSFLNHYLQGKGDYPYDGSDLVTTSDDNQRYVNIPSFIFRDRNLAALEAVVVYLKDSQGLNYSQIAKLLNRDDRTIWTTYQRAKKKQGGKA